MTLKILIADDHGILRAGLRTLLKAEPQLEVVGEAENGEEAILLAEQLKPDVILLDMSMPNLNGIETTRRLLAKLPQTKVLILTAHED